MKKLNYLLLLSITLLNLLIACGNNQANASGGYRLQNLFGYTCVTNDVSIWCER
jgi:hypothetical protein